MQKIGGARLNSSLVFLAEEAILPEPTEGSLDNPAPRKNLELLFIVGSFHHLNVDASVCGRLIDDFPVVRTVHPYQLKRGELAMRLAHQEGARVAILNVRRRDDDCEDQSQDVNKDVPLAPVDLFFPHRTH